MAAIRFPWTGDFRARDRAEMGGGEVMASLFPGKSRLGTVFQNIGCATNPMETPSF